jgi:ABC-2 type transport system permease protein
LVGERRRAAVLGAAGIGAGLLARMVADGVEPLGWLHWVSPFGLLGLAEPFAANRVAPLGVLAAAAVAFAVAAAVAGRHRDLHAGLVPGRTHHRPHPVLLRSLPRFAVRRSLGSVAAWGAGVWAYFLVIGLLASSVTVFLSDNPVFAELAAQAGFGSLTTVSGYVASLFALLAVPLGLYGASRAAAAGQDEEARRLTVVFGAPVSRLRWSLIETATAATGTVLLALGAALATWAGATAVNADVPVSGAIAGSLNVLPVAWLSLGAAILALGWLPGAVLPIGAIPAAGGFLLQVLAESLRWPEWVARLSPYQHLNAVPYDPVDWLGAIGMTVLAALLGVAGLLGFARRDLRG